MERHTCFKGYVSHVEYNPQSQTFETETSVNPALEYLLSEQNVQMEGSLVKERPLPITAKVQRMRMKLNKARVLVFGNDHLISKSRKRLTTLPPQTT